jgi:glycerate kinase
MSLKIVVAPNSFRGSLDAFAAARRISAGFQTTFPDTEIVEVPIADGGDGTMGVLQHFLGGEIKETGVLNPLGKTVSARWAILRGGEAAVIEMAEASGMRTIPEDDLNPLKATSYGTGQLIRAALEEGCRKIIIGVGGSATVDAGAGMLQALGVRLLDKNREEIGFGGGGLAALDLIDLERMDSRMSVAEITVACDVDVKLFGESGAAGMFGPQKGATPEQVEELDQNLRHFTGIVKKCLHRDLADMTYGGAAGGIAATLSGVFSADLSSGIDLILDEIDFTGHLAGCDLVITGEGKFDSQSLRGKGPLGVAREAKRSGIPVILIAGQIDKQLAPDFSAEFDAVFSTCPSPMPLQEALENAPQLLEQTARQIAGMLKISMSLRS